MPRFVDASSVFSDVLALGRIPQRVRGTAPEKQWERNLADRMIRCLFVGKFSLRQLQIIAALKASGSKSSDSDTVGRLMSEICTPPWVSPQLKVDVSSMLGRKKVPLSPAVLQALNGRSSSFGDATPTVSKVYSENSLCWKANAKKGYVDGAASTKMAKAKRGSSKVAGAASVKKAHVKKGLSKVAGAAVFSEASVAKGHLKSSLAGAVAAKVFLATKTSSTLCSAKGGGVRSKVGVAGSASTTRRTSLISPVE